ncbi:hypothetical protein EJD97_008421 [Solanum chilense]|uniref:CCHC-type domain-containing protein n=1 Tax=Solanum chilense TaxID=4083 RepID=A0A6N2AGS4_SOLCI|nr:hypothetical protein EJD97_008421 [Solanum chilense]
MGYIGEDITDGRWQKIEYDSIPNYCFYCKHQGHKESDCIVKQRDEENKTRKELDKNKPRKDNAQPVHADLQITQHKENDRNEPDHNQPRQQGVETHQHGIQDEWQVQRRRNNNQQVRFNNDSTGFQAQQAQAGMINIPTKNTYIDLELQELTPAGEVIEQHNDQMHEQSHAYSVRAHEQQVKRQKQQRLESQVNQTQQVVYQQANINTSGIDSMLPSPAAPCYDNVGVADGGEVGSCQVDNNQHARFGEGMEPGEEINTSDQIQKGPLMQSSNVDEIREVTGKQGLSPRGRKLVKQNKLTSTSKPNTRARSRGI